MLCHAFVVVALQIAFQTFKISSALQLRDFSKFIENLQRNEAKYNDVRDDGSQVEETKSNVAISSQELDELINQVANDVYSQDRNKYNDRARNLKGSRHKFRNLQNRNLQQLLSLSSQLEHRRPKEPVVSNIEENYIDFNSVNDQTMQGNDLEMYLVLNPRANLNENDFKDISGLLSQIASDSANKNIYQNRDNTRIKKEPRYKGFVIADGRRARRPRRDSLENIYSVQNSLEDYKPKRSRNDYGGAGGRTPIPYIGHRDIYERD